MSNKNNFSNMDIQKIFCSEFVYAGNGQADT